MQPVWTDAVCGSRIPHAAVLGLEESGQQGVDTQQAATGERDGAWREIEIAFVAILLPNIGPLAVRMSAPNLPWK